jgi:hypothetical protein
MKYIEGIIPRPDLLPDSASGFLQNEVIFYV